MKVLVVFFLVVCGLIFLQFDDKLSNEVTDYVSLVESRALGGSQAYLYLNGISALEDEDVITKGEEKLARYNSATDKPLALISGDDVAGDNKLPVPDGNNKLYCNLRETGCLVQILGKSIEWEGETEKFSVVNERYKKFLSYAEFTTLSKPGYVGQHPEYHYLVYGNRISILSALSLAESGGVEDAIMALFDDNTRLRKHLALADTLIHKMLFVAMLANNLDIIVYISSTYSIRDISEVASLSSAETDMTYPLVRESLIHYNNFLNLERDPEYFWVIGKLQSWFSRAAFKPNMTLNDSMGRYTELINISKLSSKEFSKRMVDVESREEEKRNLRNYAGSIINEIAMPAYYEYIGRVHDLNCKISLANYIISQKTTTLENPYGTSYNEFDRDNLICFDGPLESKVNLRCIREEI